MTIFIQVLIFSIIVIVTATAYRLVYTLRKQIECTTAMMAAMIIGSMAGLIAGTILSLNLSFSINSLLAMIIGIGAGIIIGIPFNTMAILDGLIAGVMGGLMGAMLGEMLTTSFIFVLSLFLIVIFLFSVFLLSKTVKQEAGLLNEIELNRGRIKSLSILTVCVTIGLFSIIMIGSFYEPQTSASTIDQNQTEHHHMSD
jgi:hypothetical protein